MKRLPRVARRNELRGPVDERSPQTKKVEELWLEVAIADGEWVAAYRLVPQGGQLVIGELRVFPNERRASRRAGTWSAELLGDEAVVPWGGLQTRRLRDVKPALHVRTHLPKILRAVSKRYGSEIAADLLPKGSPARELERGRRLGRSDRTDSFYALVAATYLAELRRGSRTPVADAATKLHRAPAYVRDLLTEARHRGLITRPSPGRAGGELTETGRAALKESQASRRRTRGGRK